MGRVTAFKDSKATLVGRTGNFLVIGRRGDSMPDERHIWNFRVMRKLLLTQPRKTSTS